MAVHSLDLHVRGAHGAVRATAEHTTAEHAAGTNDVRVANDLARIAATHDVHNRIAAKEVLVFFTLYEAHAAVVASATPHIHVDVSIAYDDGTVAIAAAEDAEVGRSHLLVNLSPLVALKEVFVVSSRYQLGVVVEQTLRHGKVRVAVHLTCHVAAGVDVMIDLKLQLLVVVLRRVSHAVDDAGRFP